MKKQIIKAGKAKNIYIKVIAVFLLPCLLFTAVCFGYYQQLYNTIRSESKGYLQEISGRVSSNISRIITDNFRALRTLSGIISTAEYDSFADLTYIVDANKQQWNYSSIMLIDKAGQVYDSVGSEVFVTLDNSIRELVLSNNEAMSTTQVINNNEFIIFSVPTDCLKLDGKEIVSIAASFDPKTFDSTLSMESFDDKSYSQLISKNGAIITRPTLSNTINTGYNIFTSLETAKLDAASSFKQMKEDIAAGSSGMLSFLADNSSWYMVYTPSASNNWYLLTFVPVATVNAKSDMLLQTTLIICGLIALTFAALLATLFYLFEKHKRNLEKIAYVDDVTGGSTIQRFYLAAEEILSNSSPDQYVLLYTNVEKFKVLNEQVGRTNCDYLLKTLYNFFEAKLTKNECMGRLSADNFCVLLEFKDEATLLERFKEWRTLADIEVLEKVPWGLPTMEFGLYIIADTSMPVQQMMDRAKLPLNETLYTINSKLLYAFYDDGVRRRIFREKLLEDKMEAAMADREFQVHLQPKYDITNDRIGGAEALVRWVSKSEGMIYPDEFISLFEKNGFIVTLDRWVFEEVCRLMSEWKEKGYPPIRVSVNCSKVHFKYPDFLEPYIKLADRYKIDRHLIEIEITESIVFENADSLIKIINQIRDAGFICSMDDFGSGYSSLNMLQKIPIDILKLDKSFFDINSASDERTEAIVMSVVSMAKALSMETVAEGVEYVEQMKMLKSVGCDFIQGYWYAKPMSSDAFEEFAFLKRSNAL